MRHLTVFPAIGIRGDEESFGRWMIIRADGVPPVGRATSIIRGKDSIKNLSCPAFSSVSKISLDSLFFFDGAHREGAHSSTSYLGPLLIGRVFSPFSFATSVYRTICDSTRPSLFWSCPVFSGWMSLSTIIRNKFPKFFSINFGLLSWSNTTL